MAETLAGVLIHDQIEITLTIYLVVICEARPLFRKRPQSLSDQSVARCTHGDLTGLSFKELASDADDVSQIELLKVCVVFALG